MPYYRWPENAQCCVGDDEVDDDDDDDDDDYDDDDDRRHKHVNSCRRRKEKIFHPLSPREITVLKGKILIFSTMDRTRYDLISHKQKSW